MKPNQGANAEPELRALVETLRHAITTLSRSEAVQSAAKQLNDAVDEGDAVKTEDAAKHLAEALEVIKKLNKTANELDPHVLDEAELTRLWQLPPDELVTEALRSGEFRERRMILQATEAKTNRRLAIIAISAAVIALLVPFVQRLADAL